jgi:hypothetical protein
MTKAQQPKGSEGMQPDEKIECANVSRVVRFLLHEGKLPRGAREIAIAVSRSGLCRPPEYGAALAVIVHLCREMIRLERIDAECEAQAIRAAREPMLVRKDRNRAVKLRRDAQLSLFGQATAARSARWTW